MGIFWIGLFAEVEDKANKLKQLLKYPAMTQIFSAKLLRGLVFLYDPMKNKSKKNQMQHFAKKDQVASLPLASQVSCSPQVTIKTGNNPAKYLVI